MAEQRDVQALAETVREGLIDGCAYACGCDRPGNPSACIHADRFAALDGLVLEHTRQEEALKAARGFVSTGGPLYTKDRLELLDIIAEGLSPPPVASGGDDA